MSQQRKGQWTTYLLGIAVIVFTVALVVYPKQGFDAGIAGLKMFWDIVFPSLLPFFILAELLLGLGMVRGLGVLLEPLMRPLFSVPGAGAFALSMGLAAGYPMDAVITSRFRETGMCTRIEGERLLAFTNTADPLFMITAVAVGMFKSPELGALIALAHYIAAFLVGVSFKLWGRGSEPTPTSGQHANTNIFVRAFREVFVARQEDGRPFGKLLRDSVTESMMTILMICGFIVFFAVMIEVMHLSGVLTVIGMPIAFLYHLLGVHSSLINPTLAGLLEIDIGSAQTAAQQAAPLIQRVAIVGGIIGWSGLAVHAQVASVITSTDIRMSPYFLARFLHAVLAVVFTYALWALGLGKTALHAVSASLPVFASTQAAAAGAPWWRVVGAGLTSFVWLTAGLLLVSVAVHLVRRVRVIAWRAKLRS
ncbi:sporulation integral membrane protein YlbJ [Alicyclobacillus contaminans]|uniref:sporulation integral membrane protein YlbJ n=1 Tax=Alicyclobacillus contaminans TaxID=392016 RepID=UPI000419ECEB|nr:sporulation integral membrane protein YlbJ [Alicyclobacillus contaminans]GMA48710.1 sporulation integral membrane protein YlbJ [Alicyclobacillus contaminans]